MDVVDGNGTFKSRDLVLEMKQVWGKDEKVKAFFNLDSIWYCKKVVDGNDTIAIVKEMNRYDVGENPFDKPLYDETLE